MPKTHNNSVHKRKKQCISKYLKVGDICRYYAGKHAVINITQKGNSTLVSLKKHSAYHPCSTRTTLVNVCIKNNKVINKRQPSLDLLKIHRSINVGDTVVYRDRFYTFFTCIVCSKENEMLRIQPFGIARYIDVHEESLSLYTDPGIKIADSFVEQTACLPKDNVLLHCTFTSEAGNWSGRVYDYDPTFKLYLMYRHGVNMQYRTADDTANYNWMTAEDIQTKCTMEYSADPPNLLMKYNIQLGQVTLDRTDNSKTWALWQKKFSMGDHNSIFEDMYEQATDNGMFTTPVSSGSARALFAALSLSQNKHNVCVNTHFSGQKILHEYNDMDDFKTVLRNLEHQKMQLSFASSRDECNKNMTRYFSYMNPENFDHFVLNKRNIFASHASTKVSCKIDSLDDTKLSISIIYHGEPLHWQASPYKCSRQNVYMRKIFYSLTSQEDKEVQRPHVYIKRKQLDKWYNKNTIYTNSSLPLFDYQKMMVMQMIVREENEEAALSNCFERDHCTVMYNLLTGSHNNIILPYSGGILAMDVGLGKTICILALYEHSKKKTLIVCPLTLIDQWKSEIQKFLPDETISEYHGKKKNMSGNIVLTTYGTVRSAYNQNIYFKDFHRVVFDESHVVTSMSSVTARACAWIYAECRWCLSATPIAKNSFSTLQGQLAILKVAPFVEGMMPSVFSQDTLRDEYYSHVLDSMWETIFFMQTREGLDKHGLKYDKTGTIEMTEYIDDPLVEYQNLFASIQTAVQDPTFKWSFTQLTQFTNLMLTCIVHPCLVPLTIYAERCSTDESTVQTVQQITSGMGDSNYEAEVKNSLLDLASMTCVICMEPFARPTITHCKHIFCNACIQQQIRHRPNCPMCRSSISLDTLTEITDVAQTVEEVEGMITFHSMGRKYKIQKDMYDLYHNRQKDMFDSPKMQKVAEIVNQTDENIIIFSRINSVLNLLKQRFPDQSVIITGKNSRNQRKRAIDHFQSKEKKIFILSMKCASVGLTLTSGSHIIFMEPCIDNEVATQAIGRLARTGQTKDVVVHTLLAKNSFDQRVIDLKETYEKMDEDYKNNQGWTSRNKKLFKTDMLSRLFN